MNRRKSGSQAKAEDQHLPTPASAPFDLPSFLPYRLSVTTNRISRAFAALYQSDYGLSIAEWRAMAVLGNFAPMSSNEICDRTAMDKTKVSRAISSLIRHGLVARESHPADQRLIRLSLTSDGQRVHSAIVPRARALERHLLRTFTSSEIAALHDFLDRLGKTVEARITPKTGNDDPR